MPDAEKLDQAPEDPVTRGAGCRDAGEMYTGGIDNRQPSADPRVGRLRQLPSGAPCTASIIDVCAGPLDRWHLTASHCIPGGPWGLNSPTLPPQYQFILEFDVPPSEPLCDINDSDLTDRFVIDNNSVVSSGLGGHRDWAIFRCLPNAQTNSTTFEHTADVAGGLHAFPIGRPPADPLACLLPESDPGNCVRVTGYGIDGNRDLTSDDAAVVCCCPASELLLGFGERSNTQQSAVGPLLTTPQGCQPNQIYFEVDYCADNSGSPIIVGQPDPTDFSAGRVIADLTGADCGAPASRGTLTTHHDVTYAICRVVKLNDSADGVVSVGAHMIEVTPSVVLSGGHQEPVALYVSSGYWGCPTKVITAGGTLVDAPPQAEDFLTPGQWGTVRVSGIEFVATSTYSVDYQHNGESPTPLGCTTSWIWGDVTVDPAVPPVPIDHNCRVDVDDLGYVLAAFSDPTPCVNYPLSNLLPCGADCPADCQPGYCPIDIDDILAMLDAFAGQPDPCEDPPCSGRSSPMRSTGDPSAPPVAEAVALSLVASEAEGPAGRTVIVDVFGSTPAPWRGGQLALDVHGGSSGSLQLIDLAVIPDLGDFTLTGIQTYTAVDSWRGRIVACLAVGSAATPEPRRLGTFTYLASNDAAGTFEIRPREADTLFRDAERASIAVQPGAAATVLLAHDSSTEGRGGKGR